MVYSRCLVNIVVNGIDLFSLIYIITFFRDFGNVFLFLFVKWEFLFDFVEFLRLKF